MWIFWALLSAVLVASRRPFEKRIISEIHHFSYGLVVQVLSLPVIALMLILSGGFMNPLALGLNFWLPVLAVSIGFYPVNTFLYKVAIGRGELSKVLPLQSLWPVFALLLAWLTLGEVPTAMAVIGIALTVMGVYVLGLKGKRLHHPLQPFREDGASRAMLLSVLLVTVVSVLDKIAIQASSALFYSFASTVGAALTLFVMTLLTKRNIRADIGRHMPRMLVISGLQASTYVTYLLAVAAGPIAYVSALRSSNILMGSTLGMLIFREKFTKPKLLSLLLIVCGAVLLAFGAV